MSWTETEKKMITPDRGGVFHYIGSDKVFKFDPGDCADISFPNGYGKANRVYKGYVPALTLTTIKSLIVKVEENG